MGVAAGHRYRRGSGRRRLVTGGSVTRIRFGEWFIYASGCWAIGWISTRLDSRLLVMAY